MRTAPLSEKASAFAEVALVCMAYIGFAHFSAGRIDASSMMPSFLAVREAQVGAVFAVGAIAQCLFVAAAAALLPSVREAVAATFRSAPKHAWIIALTGAAIQCVATVAFFLPDPANVVEISARHAVLKPLPLADGWSQEVVFRGYLIFRLLKAGLTPAAAIGASAMGFAAIHLGYIGSAGLGVFWPLVGTATLGGILAWSVVEGRGSVLPAVVAHCVILLVVQPWLSLAT